jgi:hypothetical protein
MSIRIITSPEITTENYRRAFVLMEERLDHYAGFREALVDAFGLTAAHADGGAPGYFRAGSGREYEVVFLSRSGHRFPSGLEIHALIAGFRPVDTEAVDEDVWRFLEWLIPRVGGEWTLDALRSTGRVYRIPWAG